LLSGAFGRARLRAREIVELLDDAQARDLELDPVYVEQWRLGMCYALGLFDATLGSHRSAQWLVELQQHTGLRSNAARVRMVYELMHGDVEAAQARRRRAELLSMQDGEVSVLPGTTARIELLAFVLADNLIGVKRTLERIAPLATAYPGWRMTFAIGRAHYRRLQGDLRGALDIIAPTLRTATIGRDMDWAWAAATHLAIVTAAGSHSEAAALALEYSELNRSTEYVYVHPTLAIAICEALARDGGCERARTVIERMIETYRGFGAQGLPLGMCYEMAARISIFMDDAEGFMHHARLCAHEYRVGRNSTLQAKFGRLLQEAEERGLSTSFDWSAGDRARPSSVLPARRIAAALPQRS
jgi:hypothetical protein